MKKLLLKLLFFVVIFLGLTFGSCIKHDTDVYNPDLAKKEVITNVNKIFGVDFPESQDWCTTINSTVKIYINTDTKINKVQILLSNVKDSISTISMLNQANVDNNDNIYLTFDAPMEYTNLYVAFIDNDGKYFYKRFDINDKEVYFNDNQNLTRSLSQDYDIPTNTPVINGTVTTFANQRGWLPGELFYEYDYQTLVAGDYDTDFKDIFRSVIFNYFPNGRSHNNLPKIKKSGYYNESSYPITTGDEPIIVSPIYKNDGGYYEICFGDLYYYYFKGEDLSVAEIEALPKYKAIDLSEVYTNDDNDQINKSHSYVLVYWGDGQPTIGTTGLYQFPPGYKIGFVYRSRTEINKRSNGTTYRDLTKQGELYCDGRLNYNINNYGSFKSSKLGATEPRMAWVSINDRAFLCVESGTDADFNDLIVEVEGGIEPIIIPPDDPENQYYTFCFEDHRLGDYDMNDVVLKGTRLDETHVEWTLMATGAYDALYIYNIEGEHIKSFIEVHELFGVPQVSFVNTQLDDRIPFITDIITVNKDFSFLDASTQPYIYDATQNWFVRIARVGEDPHAIMVPYDFRWPLEQICIKNAYLQFNNWGMGLIEDTDWYKYPEEDKVY